MIIILFIIIVTSLNIDKDTIDIKSENIKNYLNATKNFVYGKIDSLNMDKITADIKSANANKYLDSVKKLIQDRINDLPEDKQQQFISIYDSLTFENAKEYLAKVEQTLGEVNEQISKEVALWFWGISKKIALFTLFSFLFFRITGIIDEDIILIGGGFLTLILACIAYCIYFGVEF